MKTTVKRGIGRTAFPEGNGHGVLPPSVLASVSRYRQPPPPRRRLRLVGRIVLSLLASVVVVAAGLAGGVYLFAHESVGEVAAHTKEIREAQKALDITPAGRTAIALVIGYDKRAGEEAKLTGRSDTIMLLRADPGERTLSMLSFPRDLLVEIRCPRRAPFAARINEAYAACGARGTLETVKALTGLPIHYLVTVNFRGFKQIVAKLGGVWIDVDRRYFNDRGGPGGYATIDLQPGYQKLNGSDALDFVRYRHTDNDFYRIARQQLFVESFKQAVTTSFSPTKLPKIVDVVTDTVEIGHGGGKPPSLETLLRYGLLAYQLPDGHFVQTRIEGLREDAEFNLYADSAQMREAVLAFAHPEIEPTRGSRARKAKAPPPPRATSVLVLNGNGMPGAAASASDLLAERRYRMLLPAGGVLANAPRMNYTRTEVYFDPAQEGAEAAAAKVARLFGEPRVARLPRELRPIANDAMVVVVLGQTWTGSLETPERRKAEREPAAVVRNPDATLPLLREIRGRVPFPLVVTTVIEKTSSPDSDMPVRVYEAAGHAAVRLVFETGANEYWGIQMTSWTNAPAIAAPNDEVTIRGRRYRLFYDGRRLRMVVWQRGETTYWVVNTLLDSLSNETMLAIARGLKPLPGQ